MPNMLLTAGIYILRGKVDGRRVDKFSRIRQRAFHVDFFVTMTPPRNVAAPPRLDRCSTFNVRFTAPGDKVMVTAADENRLASLVLESGRHLSALVSDPTKIDDVQKEVDAACVSAIGHGWLRQLSKVMLEAPSSPVPYPDELHRQLFQICSACISPPMATKPTRTMHEPLPI